MKIGQPHVKRIAVGSVALLLLTGFIVYVWAGNVTAATGGSSISADTAATGGSGAWTALSGPAYAETINGDIGNGTVILTIPPGFEFNTASPVTVILTSGASNANTNMNGVAVGANVAGVAGANFSQTATAISFTVVSKSRGNVLNTIEWRGIQVRPLNGTPLATGNITPSGTSQIAAVASSTNFGTLTEVPGAMTKLLTVLPGQTFAAGTGIGGTASSQTAGIPFNLAELIATDQFNNPVTTYSGSKTISYAGPSSGCSIAPSYTNSVSFTNGISTTTLATTLKKAETTSITASDGAITGPASSGLTVNPAAASQLTVTLAGQSFSACSGNAGTPSSQAAGVSFTIPSITATDAYFNIISGYSGAKTLAYSGPTGAATYTTSVSFTGGQSTTALATTISTAQTTTISVSDGALSGPASSVFTVNSTVNSFNGFEPGTAAGAVSGVIRTKVSGSAFGLDIVALTNVPAVSTGFTGTVKVELVDSSSGSTCSAWPAIQTLPNQTFTAADNGRHPIASITEANAWKNARLRISYPVTSPTIVSCSSDNFSIRPATLTVATTDQDWQTAGTIRPVNNTALPGGIVHKAGQPFTISAIGRNATGATATNYAGTPVYTLAQCSSGTATCPPVASLGALTLGAWNAGGGVVTTTTASYSEVGAFSMVLQDRNFADVDLADSTPTERYVTSVPVEVGRFVPDHFALTAGSITPRTDLAACSASSFSYMDEPFGVTFQLTAQNAAPVNGTTTNYTGLLATLAPANPGFLNYGAVDAGSATALVAPITAITRANPGQVSTGTAHGLKSGGRVFLSGIGGMTTLNNALYTVNVVDANNFTIGIDTSANSGYTAGGNASRIAAPSSSGTWTAGAASITSTLMLLRAAMPDGPYNSVNIGMAPQDADGVSALISSLNLDTDRNGTNDRINLGTAQLRFGRLALQNAHGSGLLNLPIPIQAQYWTGLNFQPNAQDNCTSISLAGSVLLNNYQGGINTANMASPGNVVVGGAFAAGIGRLQLTKPNPPPTAKGSVDLSVDLSLENKAYLQGNWSGSIYNQNPKSRASFGIYKGGSDIYRREMY